MVRFSTDRINKPRLTLTWPCCVCTTPISSNLPSPMEILTGRKAMSNIPTKLTSSQPEDNIRKELWQHQLTQKMYHDQHAKGFPHLATGQPVLLQDHQTREWREATVLEKSKELRLYLLTTPQGQQLRRNRVHICDVPRPANTNSSPISSQRTTARSPSPHQDPNNHQHSQHSNNQNKHV